MATVTAPKITVSTSRVPAFAVTPGDTAQSSKGALHVVASTSKNTVVHEMADGALRADNK